MKHTLPFLKGLQKYTAQQVYPFHTPGHKGGRGVLPELQALLAQALIVDVSLMEELDDLHQPQGILLQAQEQAAKLYGAEQSFFCVNGTSGALHAMILASVQPGEQILVPRNAHRSIAGALVISGAQPIYVQPEFDREFGLATQITAEAVAEQLHKHPELKAVLVTSPNYYGIAADLHAIAKVVHAHKAVLLIDEAHGPHLGFSDLLPPSALQAGADACAQSTHKIVGALTQCSVLHVQQGRLNIEKFRQAFSLLTTTSPNQLLLASLDGAFYQLANNGQAMVEQAVALADYFRRQLAQIDKIKVLDWPEASFFDRTKVTVKVSGLGLTGYEAAASLRELKLAVELADTNNILFLLTYADEKAALDRAVQAIKQLPQKQGPLEQANLRLPEINTVMTPRVAFFSPTVKKRLGEAQGCVAAEEITFYPPGIPAVLPGELITKELIDYCQAYAQAKSNYLDKYINVVQ